MKLSFYITILTLLGSPSLLAQSKATKKASDEKTEAVPEITYRQASLDQRKTSVFHKASDKDYADQLYLSLKLVKTYQFINEVTIEPAIRTKRNKPGEIETVIDQGYVRAYQNKFNFTAGKKVEYEGSGYFVNPSDLLNEKKDLFDPLYQREGKVFSRLGYGWDSLNLGIGYIPKQKASADEGKTWVQLGSEVAETDLRMQYTYNRIDLSTVGISAARFFSDHFELHLDTRYQQRQRSIEQQDERKIFDCDVVDFLKVTNEKGEEEFRDKNLSCLEPTVEDNQASTYTVFGSRIVFTPKRTVIFEGIQNQGGMNAEEQEMYYRYVGELRDSTKSGSKETEPPERILGRQYWFLAYQDEDSIKRTMMSLAGLYSQTDQSIFSNAEVKYTFTPFANASIVYTRLLGKAYSEFGESPFSQTTYLIFRGRF